jgi:hypothetical protein
MDAHHMETALAAGIRAGRLLLPYSCNPYRDDDPLYAEWIRGWRSATSSVMFDAFTKRRAA